MKDYYLTAASLGLGLAAIILYLIRRDHLYLRDGLFWIVVAMASLLFGLWPALVDRIGMLVGVAYPPALLFLIAIAILILRSLTTDIALTRVRRDLRRLNQRIVLAETLIGRAASGEPAGPRAPQDREFEIGGRRMT
jgi:hypothetical protein